MLPWFAWAIESAEQHHDTARSPAMVRLDAQTPFYEYRSSLLVGDKGEQRLDVRVPADQCGTVWAFDHAVLTVLDSRFADAQLVEIPEAGCTECRPLIVRWYHEPTGRIHFKVDVYRRRAEKLCVPEQQPGPTDPFGERGPPRHVGQYVDS